MKRIDDDNIYIADGNSENESEFQENDNIYVVPEASEEETPADGKVPRGAHILYIVLTVVVFIGFTVVFLFFPRTRYSELEKRELAEFPDMSSVNGNPAELTAAISQWFSDSEPFRDNFMTFSMGIRDAMRFSFGGDEEIVSFKPAATAAGSADGDAAPGTREHSGEFSNPFADENAKIADAGIVIVGSGAKVRALMAFGGGEKATEGYAELLNEYARKFPSAKVYALIAPLASEFYLPEKASECSRSQRKPIQYAKSRMSGVRFVDAYGSLAEHVNEDIYLRTDHHWAPLGGYYAAKELAAVAGVPFRDLKSYERHVIKNFVGSMYGYSKDISVKKAPEDFVYYTPKNVDYTTTYVTYTTNKNYQVVSESKPQKGQYFYKFKDGSGNAYLTFMGSDQKLVKVETSTSGNRRLLIIKDSYGNTLPGYMFYSFSEVHVVDFRYFKKNLINYVRDNKITDIVIAFNIFNACNKSSISKVRAFLTQSGGGFASPDRPEAKEKTLEPRHESLQENGQEKAKESHKTVERKEEETTMDKESNPAVQPNDTTATAL